MSRRLLLVRRYVNQCRKWMGIPTRFRIRIQIGDCGTNVTDNLRELSLEKNLGVTVGKAPFKSMTLRISPECFKDKEYGGVRRTVFHEMVHVWGAWASKSEAGDQREEALAEALAKRLEVFLPPLRTRRYRKAKR